MATISLTIADALDAKATTLYGTKQGVKDFLKAELKRAVLNDRLRQIEAGQALTLQAARDAAMAEDATL